ncbi:hypothetical protein KUCAC02_036287, partial [Chaenocephalus aceratus]
EWERRLQYRHLTATQNHRQHGKTQSRLKAREDSEAHTDSAGHPLPTEGFGGPP